MNPMEIRLNGKMRAVEDRATIRQLLDGLKLHPMRVAVQVNETIIKRDRFDEVLLKPGDTVEVLTIMAGGCGGAPGPDGLRSVVRGQEVCDARR
jgi:thiamine biosynthesis protein ThiS